MVALQNFNSEKSVNSKQDQSTHMDHPFPNEKSTSLENFNPLSINQTNSREAANNSFMLVQGETNKKSKIRPIVNIQ